jgi:hypothetical protein
MHGSHLLLKRSQSECLIAFGSRIYSPSPIKPASRIGATVAREIFEGMPPKIEEFEFDMDEIPLPSFSKAKSCAIRIVSDSYNEWGSESTFSGHGFSGECDSPSRSSMKNPLSQDSISEELSMEIPSRTSNPIVYDANFRQYEKKSCGFPFKGLQSSKLNPAQI